MNSILPVGSIVNLSEDSALPIMVLGFFPYDRDDKKYYEYSGCVYPSGLNDAETIFLFNSDDIKKVIFEGYKTDAAMGWIKGIKEQLKSEQEGLVEQ